MNKRHYEHTLPNIRGSLSNTYKYWTMTVTRSAMKNGLKKYIAGWTMNGAT